MRAIGFLTVGALLFACGSPGTGGKDGGGGNSGPPRIATIPAKVDFGVDAGMPVDIQLTAQTTLTIYNSGGGTLVMSQITLTGDPAFSANRPATMSLDAGDRTDMTITFAPTEVRTHTGTVVITSNASNAGSAGIPMVGVGKQP